MDVQEEVEVAVLVIWKRGEFAFLLECVQGMIELAFENTSGGVGVECEASLAVAEEAHNQFLEFCREDCRATTRGFRARRPERNRWSQTVTVRQTA